MSSKGLERSCNGLADQDLEPQRVAGQQTSSLGVHCVQAIFAAAGYNRLGSLPKLLPVPGTQQYCAVHPLRIIVQMFH